MKAFLIKVAVAAICVAVCYWAFGTYVETDRILHNGTNRDDDPARMLGGVAILAAFVASLTFFSVLASIGAQLFRKKS